MTKYFKSLSQILYHQGGSSGITNIMRLVSFPQMKLSTILNAEFLNIFYYQFISKIYYTSYNRYDE